jgi:hypothetical protein
MATEQSLAGEHGSDCRAMSLDGFKRIQRTGRFEPATISEVRP